MERRIERFRRIVDRLSYLASKDAGELSVIAGKRGGRELQLIET